MAAIPQEITQLLLSWSEGDNSALDRLIPLVYPELRRLARQHMRRENAGHTLQTSALINEAYLRLVDQQAVKWQGRAHFFAVAAQVMRHILIDHARSLHYAKRGAGAQHVPLDEVTLVSQERAAEFVALDESLTLLAAVDPRKSQIVELRFFGGLTVEEAAEVMKLSSITIKREWRSARAWLHLEMSKGAAGEVAEGPRLLS
jgi:RNA polymerase sigma factor (TIGR02999 family)